MADKIGVDVGDDGRNINAGKNNEQSVSERTGNVVNNYVDSNNPEPRKRHQTVTLEERLDRLEVARNVTERTLNRIVALMDGDPGYRIVGIPDQLAIYIKANEDWKDASEKRILASEAELKTLRDELGKLKSNKQIVIAPSTAILLVMIGALCLVVAFFILSWLQGAGG